MGEYMRKDPAIERWNTMREDVYKYFRWTPRTTITAVIGLGVVPGLIYYLASKEDYKWNWHGKRKGETLLASPSSS
ncbi:hypothetical protein K474DRAFT_1710738 [Panus rudis PR-1116 ss-1]|nr:hypothetical protein K474DRAFT_1710738 [Panus rudis PR-1116 ss-1]